MASTADVGRNDRRCRAGCRDVLGSPSSFHDLREDRQGQIAGAAGMWEQAGRAVDAFKLRAGKSGSSEMLEAPGLSGMASHRPDIEGVACKRRRKQPFLPLVVVEGEHDGAATVGVAEVFWLGRPSDADFQIAYGVGRQVVWGMKDDLEAR